MNLYTSLTLRYLKENKKRSIVTIVGIILSTALICGISTIYESFMDFETRLTIKNNGNYHSTFYDVNKDHLEYISKSAGVSDYSISYDEGYSKTSEEIDTLIRIKAYDDKSFEVFGINLLEGKLPSNENEIVLTKDIINSFENQYKVGDYITLNLGKRVNDETGYLSDASIAENEYIKDAKECTFKLVGIIEKPSFQTGNSINLGFTYIDNNKIKNNNLLNVSIRAKDPKQIYRLSENIAKNSNMEMKSDSNGEKYYHIKYNEHLLRVIGASTHKYINTTITSITILVSSLVIICTIATVYNAFSISINERKKQFGVLNSIGATNSQIIKLVTIEGILISIIAIPIGLICGTLAIEIVFKVIEKLFNSSMIAQMDLRVIYNIKTIGISTLIVLSTVFVSVLLPAVNASRVSPLEAIKNSGDYKINKVKDSRLVKFIFKTEGVLAYKNLRRNKMKFRTTLFSLIVSIVIFISFSGFMNTLLKAQQIMAGQMTYDIELSSNGKVGKNISENILKDITNIENIKNFVGTALYSDNNLNVDIKSNKINKEYESLIQRNWQIKEDEGTDTYIIPYIDLVFPGEEAINNLKLKQGEINKQLAIDEIGIIISDKSYYEEPGKKGVVKLVNYNVGDTITAYTTEYDEKTDKEVVKEKYKFKILATTEDLLPGDYMHPHMGIKFITYDEVGEELGFNIRKEKFYIDTNNNQDTIKEVKEVGSKYNYNVFDQREEMLSIKQTYNAMEVFVYGFIIVISLVSVTNIINTISTNLNLRKKELAIIQSIGVTPQGFNKMIYLESILYGLVSLLYGVPISIGINIIMTKVISGVIDMETIIPYEAIFIAVVGVFVITFISAYIPMRKLNKESIIDNIRQDSI